MPSMASVVPGTRPLSDVARRLAVPVRMVDSVWFDLDSTFRKMGVEFDAWQDGAGQLILGVDEAGQYTATVEGVGMSLPRQVGKTYLIGHMMFALSVRYPGLLILWTAHHGDTSAETFTAMEGLSHKPLIAPHILKRYTSDNHKEIIFRNGSRILFGARARGFGRGIPGVDIIVCDEAQILPERAMDDMLAAMNTAKNGLAIFVGTPPKPTDPADAFKRMRAEAMADENSDGLVWIECGADPDADPDDHDQWERANPSYPHRTPMTSMMRLRKRLSPDSWLREGLGIWDDDAIDVFAGQWGDLLRELPTGLEPAALAVATGIEQTHSSITAAAVDEDGVVHVRSLQYGPGVGWLVEAAKTWSERFNVPVAIDGRGPAAPLVSALEFEGIDLRVLSTDEVCNASSEIARLVSNELLAHRADPELDGAVKNAAKRPVLDRWAWGRRISAGDISPLEGVTLAAWIALNETPAAIYFPKTRQKVLVVGPRAAEWAELHAPDAEVREDMQRWERDAYRRRHDARVVVVVDGYVNYVPSVYGREDLVEIGEG
jgi:hypothetical protein